jgi:putative transposase
MKKKVNRGIKIRIFPNDVQTSKIEQTFGCVRHIWNYSLMEKLSILDLYGNHPELYRSHTYKLQKDWKVHFPFYKDVDSQALNTEQQILNRTFKHWLKGVCKKPRYKSKKSLRNSYTSHTTNNNIRIEEDFIVIPKVGKVKLSKTRRKLARDTVIKAITVSKSAIGKYYVSLRLELEQETKVRNNDMIKSIGLDFSMTHFYVDNEGKKANFPCYIRETVHKIKKIDRKMSRQKKDSKGREKTRIKRAKLYEKMANQKKDFHHKLSRRLAKENDVITVETLSLKEMDEYKTDKRKVQLYGFHQFLTFLEYKCQEEGSLFHKVDPYYPSTKMCSYCQSKKTKMPRSERVYICEHCGTIIDRDINAAINLATQGMIKYLTKNIEDRTASLAWSSCER